MPDFSQLTEPQLLALYFRFAIYRDTVCGGRADISIISFYQKGN